MDDLLAPLRIGTRVIVQFHSGQFGTVRGHTARAGRDPGYLITLDGGARIEAPRWQVFPVRGQNEARKCA
ncbi:MAG: hypothetical protein ABT940_03105 [Alphaproteobacteria bacterium]